MSQWPPDPARPDVDRTAVLHPELPPELSPRGRGGRRPDQRRGRPDPGGQRPRGPDQRPGPRDRVAGATPARGRPRRSSRRRGLLRLLALLLGLVVLGYLALGAVALGRLEKVDALRDYDGRPADVRGETWLLVGSDSRQGLSRAERARLRTGSSEGARTDTVLLLHVPSDGRPALVSLPRDSFVRVPAYTDGSGRRRPAHPDKLNAAYSLGGAPLLARTVERETGLRVDHYMEVGFGGGVGVTDAVGGVDMCVPRALKDARAGLDVRAGCQTLDGATALGYVRARYSDPRGDLGRIERQQAFLAALTEKATSPRVLLNPVAQARLALSGSEAVVVDEGSGPLAIVGAARAMSAVSSGSGSVLTVPVADADARTSAGSAVLWDEDAAEELFDALRAGRTPPTAR